MAKRNLSNGNTTPNRREKRQQGRQDNFQLKKIRSLTTNQETAFTAYKDEDHLMLHGFAGTGKTFCALYLALNQLLNEDSPYEKIIIIRSVVPSRDMGFLPGSAKEKSAVYEEPYKEIADELFGRGDGYEILKMKNLVQFTTTSFLRGLTFNRAIVIVDEIQNMLYSEINTIMTRMGEESRILLCGDFRQTDLKKYSERSGLIHFMKITENLNSFSHIEFESSDIVRSGLVKQYLIESTKYFDRNDILIETLL